MINFESNLRGDGEDGRSLESLREWRYWRQDLREVNCPFHWVLPLENSRTRDTFKLRQRTRDGCGDFQVSVFWQGEA